MVSVLPGDCMYPENVDITAKQEFDRTTMTIEEFRNRSPVKNRIEFYSLDVKSLAVDATGSPDGHLAPLCIDSVQTKSSKL